MHLGFAPQTRGSTVERRREQRELWVCPADAGVYLRR